MATIKVTIDLELTTDFEPDTGQSVDDLKEATIKEAVYAYLTELIDDDSLDYRTSWLKK